MGGRSGGTRMGKVTMKGSIAQCAEELVRVKFGDDVWDKVCSEAGLPSNTKFMPSSDVDDEAVIRVIGAIGKTAGLSEDQVSDAFGTYWVCDYAPRQYPAYYRKLTNARAYLLEMDRIHTMVTTSITNAKPPKFTYEWADDCTLVMTYQSDRGLHSIFRGLIKGVGEYFKEPLEITMRGATATIKFSSSSS